MADNHLIPDREHVYSQAGSAPLILRFPKDTWNAYDTYSPIQNGKITKNTHARKKATARNAAQSFPRRKPKCKSKLSRFLYGGPQRRVTGQQMNEIHYEQPCLSSTCPNCQYWYPNWFELDGEVGNAIAGAGTEYSRGAERCRSEAQLLTPPASPKSEKTLWQVPLDSIDPTLLQPHCDVFPPSKLVDQVIQPSISAKTQWRSPLDNQPLRPESYLPDKITTTVKHNVLAQPKSILKSPLRKTGVRKDDRGREKKVRFRHRVLCVFQSKQGKDKFRRVVECL